VSGQKTRRPGEIAIAPGSGIDKARRCTCWPKPDDPRPCTPQTCDWRCRACQVQGRPFYSHGDLEYLEHGTGPLVAELDRLWQAKGTMKGGTAEPQRPMRVTAGELCRGARPGWRQTAPTFVR
jgi:hypothetical protein